jgi:short-subunit dehydrogenase
MDLELKGKRAVITGGSVGIGLAVAKALASERVDVVIIARDKARVERLRKPQAPVFPHPV